jgi:hypothetical protein
MAMRESYNTLASAVAHLDDALTGLRFTVVEDEPSPSHALVTAFGDAVEDLSGWLREAAPSVVAGARAASDQSDLQAVWRGLEAGQEAANRMGQRLSEDLLAYDVVDQLSRLGRERGREWASWASTVRQGLDDVQGRLHLVNAALLECWKELAERNGSTWVSVRATNIGQHLTVPGSDLAAEGFP